MNSPFNGKFKVTQQFKGKTHDGLDLVGLDSKEIHSTTDGTVEKAGWENVLNKKQGFGLYVRIKQNGSTDKYYYGHLSELKVKAGQAVKKGDIIGIEGSTGRSTGSHCHYCVRGNGLKSQIRDICEISGIPNKIGTYFSSDSDAKTQTKSVSELAAEVMLGKWGNGNDRRQRLTAAGYDYSAVQAEVNRIADKTVSAAKKTDKEIAQEVILGKWGNGSDRRQRLTEAGYDYAKIQKIVNELVG